MRYHRYVRCLAKGTTSLRRIQEITPPPIIVGVVAWADCLVVLQQRQVDAVSTDDTGGKPTMKTTVPVDDLDAPVLRITSADAPAFYSPPIEKLQLPDPDEIVARALTIC